MTPRDEDFTNRPWVDNLDAVTYNVANKGSRISFFGSLITKRQLNRERWIWVLTTLILCFLTYSFTMNRVAPHVTGAISVAYSQGRVDGAASHNSLEQILAAQKQELGFYSVSEALIRLDKQKRVDVQELFKLIRKDYWNFRPNHYPLNYRLYSHPDSVFLENGRRFVK